MTLLHARVDVMEGQLPKPLVGGAPGLRERTFAVLTLTDDEGRMGVGEASPLPGYSPDSIDDVTDELQALVDEPLDADGSSDARAMLDQMPEVQLMESPSARFALECALLDWLGRAQGKAMHRLLATAHPRSIPIADLVLETDPALWPDDVDRLCGEGATHIKFKVGAALEEELAALRMIRGRHPALPIRIDANGRIDIAELTRCAGTLASLDLELVEEPVALGDWREAAHLSLPFALDETLRDESTSRWLLAQGRVRALVIKPAVLGGLTAALDLAKIAADHGAQPVLSHTFDGPIARAATAELALALRTELAAGLGWHPALESWPPHRIAAIHGREIRAHEEPGLGLEFEDGPDA